MKSTTDKAKLGKKHSAHWFHRAGNQSCNESNWANGPGFQAVSGTLCLVESMERTPCGLHPLGDREHNIGDALRLRQLVPVRHLNAALRSLVG
jgi:hypothetical protein